MASPSTLSALQLYEEAVRGGQRCTVRWEDGGTSELPVERWLAAPTQAELELLSRAPAPVLDVGCGAGRLVLALAQQRVPALGVDVAAAAVRLGRERGAPVLEASVFETVPGHGWWASALLAAKDHVNVFLYDGAMVPDPDGIITSGHDNKTARTVAIRRGETINASALTEILRAIVANNRAGGWRKLKRETG